MFNNFQEIANAINERGYVHVALEDIYKNGKKRDILKVLDEQIAPVYYLSDDDLIKKTEEIEEVIVNATRNVPFEINEIERRNNIDNVQYKVVPFDYYKEEIKAKDLYFSLKDNGLVEIYYNQISKGIKIYITNEWIKEYNWNKETLELNAHANNYNKLQITTMRSMLTTIMDIDIPEDNYGTYVVTNEEKVYGGAYITDMAALDYISKNLKTDEYYIIPLSIHELLIIVNPDMDIQELKKIVQEINDKEVDPSERLSYNVWKYENGNLRMF